MVTRSFFLKKSGGWTLIELMIVMSLITVLAGIALVGYRNAVTRSREAVLKEDLFRMRGAIDQYFSDKGAYPSELEDLVSEGYLRSIPTDPLTGSEETWQIVLADFDPLSSFSQQIYGCKECV